jgi:hypothetical protein
VSLRSLARRLGDSHPAPAPSRDLRFLDPAVIARLGSMPRTWYSVASTFCGV